MLHWLQTRAVFFTLCIKEPFSYLKALIGSEKFLGSEVRGSFRYIVQ